MVRIEVRLPGGLFGGVSHIKKKQLRLCRGVTVTELLEYLILKFGDGLLGPTTLVIVNGESVPEGFRRDWALEDGDVVSVVRSFTGG